MDSLEQQDYSIYTALYHILFPSSSQEDKSVSTQEDKPVSTQEDKPVSTQEVLFSLHIQNRTRMFLFLSLHRMCRTQTAKHSDALNPECATYGFFSLN